MDEDESSNLMQVEEKPIFIFIGEYLSPSEIHIHNLPSFYDAIHLACKQSYIREYHESYQYLRLEPNKPIHFYYHDRFEKRNGHIYYQNGKLQITMEYPAISFGIHFLIQIGDKLLFLFYPPHSAGVCCNTVPR